MSNPLEHNCSLQMMSIMRTLRAILTNLKRLGSFDMLRKIRAKAIKRFRLCRGLHIAPAKSVNLYHKSGSGRPLVSVIVPNYNCEQFLAKRLDSIINQTFKDFEIIILDDASTDGSLKIIEKYCQLPYVKLFKGETNSGSPFEQWQKGFMQAKGDILWFAEADDFCELDFLQRLLPSFNDDSVALAYCDSVTVDSSDSVTGDYDSYLSKLDCHHWESSYKVSAVQEINFGLGVKNTIPNASAVLIRKNCVSEKIFTETLRFKFSGDWYFYTRAIKGRNISFYAVKLNYHRKHGQTVSSKFNTDKAAIQLLLKEAEEIHISIMENYSINSDYLRKWECYITDQILAFYPNRPKAEFNRFYPYGAIQEKIGRAIANSEKGRRLVFVTTNDAAPNGGSEQLWIESAKECRKRGHDVMVVIRKWDPAPYFIQEFLNIGIEITFKGRDDVEQVLMFQPDLVIISTGDNDEGIEWYGPCQMHHLSYVIINQLTKEPEYSPIRSDINEQVKNGYLGAARVSFTCNNNRRVMEKRLNCEIPNAIIHYNPFHVDRNNSVPFPSMNEGLKIAIPANLLRIHKGQHLAIEVFSLRKWKQRPIQLHLYGEGPDEEVLKAMATKYRLDKVYFHKPVRDLKTIWRDNHAILLPSFMEGLPVVLVGAMICARVPILTDIGGHSEVVEDNINGFIAGKPTVEALDEALERAYQKSAIWEEIGKKARQSILNYLPENPIAYFIDIILPLATKEKFSFQ